MVLNTIINYTSSTDHFRPAIQPFMLCWFSWSNAREIKIHFCNSLPFTTDNYLPLERAILVSPNQNLGYKSVLNALNCIFPIRQIDGATTKFIILHACVSNFNKTCFSHIFNKRKETTLDN